MKLHIETDEQIEAVNALQKFSNFIANVEKDVLDWKWAIITLHNSIQELTIKTQ